MERLTPMGKRCCQSRFLLPAAAIVLAASAGCGGPSPVGASHDGPATGEAVPLRLVKPQRVVVRHPIEQPGFNIEAFQETPIYAKISGYVRRWHVDIGNGVVRDQVLAE